MIGRTLKNESESFQKRPAIDFNRPLFTGPWLPVLGSLLSGVLLALGFPGFGRSTLVFAALVPLMYAVQNASVKKAAGLALLCGFVFFMISLSWLHNLTGMVENIGIKISALAGYAVLALYCALYFVPFGICVALGCRQWTGGGLWKNIRFMFAVSMVWVGCEYLRGRLLTGFPWNPIGVSQYANPAIIQVAEWGGVGLVSAYIVWMNAGIFVTLRQYTHGSRIIKYRPHYELMLGILPLAFSMMYGMQVILNPVDFPDSVHVALIQPNVPQSEKWDYDREEQIRGRLEELTHAAMRLDGVDLVIWPETALPDYVRYSSSSFSLVRRMTAGGTPLLAGSLDVVDTESGRTYYNSSILFEGGGEVSGRYDKQHLVPFGEYVPFPSMMRAFTPVEVDLRPGAGSTILSIGEKAPFSVLICFEDTVARLAVNATRAGARWLVNQTNDGWFDPSSQSEQHLAHAVFRCIENRIPMARCCNSGVTCLIDAYGRIERSLAPRTYGFTTGVLRPRPADLEQTFYTRSGDLLSPGALVAGLAVFVVLIVNERRSVTGNPE
ncbi:MAG TPA: apolipoprotein N-acyltransferase [Pontiella sp.]